MHWSREKCCWINFWLFLTENVSRLKQCPRYDVRDSVRNCKGRCEKENKTYKLFYKAYKFTDLFDLPVKHVDKSWNSTYKQQNEAGNATGMAIVITTSKMIAADTANGIRRENINITATTATFKRHFAFVRLTTSSCV